MQVVLPDLWFAVRYNPKLVHTDSSLQFANICENYKIVMQPTPHVKIWDLSCPFCYIKAQGALPQIYHGVVWASIEIRT